MMSSEDMPGGSAGGLAQGEFAQGSDARTRLNGQTYLTTASPKLWERHGLFGVRGRVDPRTL